MTAILGFLSGGELGLASRLSRLRWRRAVPARAVEIPADRPARGIFAAAELWVVVRDPAAIPLGEPAVPDPKGRSVLLAGRPDLDPSAAHTLREIESTRARAASATPSSSSAALAFRPSELPSRDGENVGGYIERLLADPTLHRWDPGFLAFGFDDSSERDRPELTRLLRAARGRLLDVGCGAGGAGAAVKAAGEMHVTGIERDAAAAARARGRLDRVFVGDALESLDALLSAGERFDGLLFADVLEHLADPFRALARARALASDGAMLVASVPNVGHLSVIRDLLLGRFDPVPAGLCDSGHVRWFTRASFAEALEESGWRVDAITSIPGAPAPDAAGFLTLFSGWPGLDRESLGTYQWVAVARPA